MGEAGSETETSIRVIYDVNSEEVACWGSVSASSGEMSWEESGVIGSPVTMAMFCSGIVLGWDPLAASRLGTSHRESSQAIRGVLAPVGVGEMVTMMTVVGGGAAPVPPWGGGQGSGRQAGSVAGSDSQCAHRTRGGRTQSLAAPPLLPPPPPFLDS